MRGDVVELGDEIRALDLDVQMPGANEEAKADYETALGAYERASAAVDRARTPQDLEPVGAAVEEGRYAMASARARLEGKEPPERTPPCFFDPRHGPSSRTVMWSPPWGEPREVPACEADAQRVERGEEPDPRQVTLGGRQVPYWNAGPAYAPYMGGFFGGGLLPGIFLGSVLGGGMWGGGYGGWGPGDSGGGGWDSGSGGGGTSAAAASEAATSAVEATSAEGTSRPAAERGWGLLTPMGNCPRPTACARLRSTERSGCHLSVAVHHPHRGHLPRGLAGNGGCRNRPLEPRAERRGGVGGACDVHRGTGRAQPADDQPHGHCDLVFSDRANPIRARGDCRQLGLHRARCPHSEVAQVSARRR